MTDAGSATTARSSVLASLLKGTALYSVALFSYRIAGTLLLPVNTRFLNPTDYGVLELLEQVVTITSVLLGLNLSSSLAFFFFEKDSPEEQNRVASTTIIGATFMGFLVALLGCIFARPIGLLVFGQAGYGLYLAIMFLSLPVAFCLEAQLSWLRVVNRPTVFAMIALVRVVVTVVVTLIFVAVLRLGVLGVITSSLTAALVAAVVLTIYCLRFLPLTVDFKLVVRMARFTVPISLGGIAMFIIHFGDRFILPHYRPLSDLGIYGIAYKIGMLISLFSGSFNSYWSAQVFPLLKREDAGEMIARIFTYLLLALSTCSLVLIVFARPVVRLLTTPQYSEAAAIAPVIILAYYFRSLAEFFRCFFIVHGRPGYESICNWTGAAVCLAGYFLLIPRFGIWGAGFATLFTFVVIGAMSIIWTYRLKPYHFEIGRITKVTCAFAGVLVLYWMVPVIHSQSAGREIALQTAWAGSLLLMFVGGLWALRVASPGEIAHARNTVRRITDQALRMTGRR